MDITPEEFLKLTTEGYPITLKHPQEEFFRIFSEFVNTSKENSFYAESLSDCAKVHAGMKTEVCYITYEEDRVLIHSDLSENEDEIFGEFPAAEAHRILGYACIGVIYFCDLYALGTGQSKGLTPRNELDTTSAKIANATKEAVWPI